MSKTQLETWLKCPKRFEYVYVHGIPIEQKVVPLQLGGMFHSFAKDFFDNLDYTVLESFKAPCNKQQLLGFFNGYIQEKMQPILKQMCYNFLDFEASAWKTLVAQYDNPLYYFKPLSTELAISTPTKFGFIDRIDRVPQGGLCVIEYKTGHSINYYEVRRDLAWYTLMLQETKLYEEPVTLIACYNPRINEHFTDKVTDKLLAATKRRILQFQRARKHGKYEWREGFQCTFCPVLSHCLSDRNSRGDKHEN